MAKPSWLERARLLRLVLKRAVNSLQTGAHASLFKGMGLSFEEVRHYQPGDEIRLIDWNVTARFGQPFVKRFIEERELRILFVVDISGSQLVGSGPHLKRDIAAEILAFLSLAGLQQGDSLGLVLGTDQVEKYVPPRRGLRHALRLIHLALYHETDHTRTKLAQLFEFSRKILKRRAIVVVLSDFLDHDWQNALNRLAHRHEVIAIRTRDPLDTHLPASGLVTVEDAETGERRLVDTKHLSKIPATTSIPSRGRFTWIEVSTTGAHLEQLFRELQARRSQSKSSIKPR